MNRSSFTEDYELVSRNDNVIREGHSNQDERMSKLYEGGGLLHERETFSRTGSHKSSINLERTFLQKWNSYWVWELIACLGSMICLGVIAYTVKFLDGTPASKWTLKITPAAFISIFITISRFLMLVGVTHGIAQLRWLYFLGGPRRLDHLDNFDAASRGPLGSLIFTCTQSIRGTAPTVARLGALVTVIALAMDPFAQQVVTFEIRTENSTRVDDAYMWATNLSSDHDDRNVSVASADIKRRAYYGGLVNLQTSIDFGCTSGNCTWEDFSSLGYCMPCEDVTDTVVTTCAPNAGILHQNCTVLQHTLPDAGTSLTLQNGSFANGIKTYTLIQSNSSGIRPEGIRSPDMFNFMMAQLLVTRNSDDFNTTNLAAPSWNLTSCSARYCAKVYRDVSVTKGVYSNPTPEDISLVARPDSKCFTDESLLCQEFIPAKLDAMPPQSDTNFSVVLTDSDSTIRNVLVFDYNLTTNADNVPLNSRTNSANNLAVAMFWNRNITAVFQVVAASLTDFHRMTSSPRRVGGKSSSDVSYMEVRFGYLALPAALVVVGAIFLIGVIVYTARGVQGERIIWKTSTLPLLMHGLDGYSPGGYARAETTGAIISKASEMTVHLKRNEDDEIRFVRESEPARGV